MAQELDDNPSSLIWDTWFKDPIMIAVLRAMVSWQVRSGRVDSFGWDMADALAQRYVCPLHSCSLEVKEVHY